MDKNNNKLKYALQISLGEVYPGEVSVEGVELFSSAIVCFDKDHLLKTIGKEIIKLKRYIQEYFEQLEFEGG